VFDPRKIIEVLNRHKVEYICYAGSFRFLWQGTILKDLSRIPRLFPSPRNMSSTSECTFCCSTESGAGDAVRSIEDQAGMLKPSGPEEIGVQLTEGFMMDPEASVSALVFHHPDCTYFGVGEAGE
jgi:hypothetical protein